MRPQDASGWPIFNGARVTVSPGARLKRFSAVVIDDRTVVDRIKVRRLTGAQHERWVQPRHCIVQRQGPKARRVAPKVPTTVEAPYRNPFPRDEV